MLYFSTALETWPSSLMMGNYSGKKYPEEYGKFYFLWTFSSSPIIHDEKIILQVLQRDTPVHPAQQGGGKQNSYILALSLDEVKKSTRPHDLTKLSQNPKRPSARPSFMNLTENLNY